MIKNIFIFFFETSVVHRILTNLLFPSSPRQSNFDDAACVKTLFLRSLILVIKGPLRTQREICLTRLYPGPLFNGKVFGPCIFLRRNNSIIVCNQRRRRHKSVKSDMTSNELYELRFFNFIF